MEAKTIKLLALSDIHDRFERFAPDLLPDADLCIVAGDLTNFGTRGEGGLSEAQMRRIFGDLIHLLQPKTPPSTEIRRARNWLEALAQRYPVLWIPGNHDIGVDCETFGGVPGCVCILDKTVMFAGLRLHGVSLSPCYDAPFLAEQWDYMTTNSAEESAAFDFEPVDIVVSHCPPYGCLDSGGYVLGVGQAHYGSPALRDYIARNAPRLVLCGHIHEGQGTARLDATEVYNVAQTWQVIEIAGRKE